MTNFQVPETFSEKNSIQIFDSNQTNRKKNTLNKKKKSIKNCVWKQDLAEHIVYLSVDCVQCNFRFVIILNEKNAGCVCASMASITVLHVNRSRLLLFLSIVHILC